MTFESEYILRKNIFPPHIEQSSLSSIDTKNKFLVLKHRKHENIASNAGLLNYFFLNFMLNVHCEMMSNRYFPMENNFQIKQIQKKISKQRECGLEEYE